MTGDSCLFSKLEKKNGGNVTFGDNAKGKVVGIGTIGKDSSTCIDNVLLVDGLKHNLLSVSQLCDKGYKVTFDLNTCLVTKSLDDKVVFKGKRSNNVYTIDLHSLTNQNVKCLVSISNDAWLWHRRLGHASMSLLESLCKGEHVRDLPKIKFSKDKMCDACQMGKQAKSSFKPKNQVSTSRPLELLHMDLVGT